MNSDFLYVLVDWFGTLFEKMSPAVFKVIVAVLPYLSPIPVAAYTASSATQFLGFSSNVSLIFVLVLEGIGIWVTTALVESIVDWVRSRNSKTSVFVIVFLVVTVVYVVILVTLNVTLHESLNQAQLANARALQLVVTLLCFLPLISGICNGMYKVRLQGVTEARTSRARQQELEDEARRLENERISLQQSQSFQLESKKLEAQAEIERKRLEVEAELKREKLKAKLERSSHNNALPTLPEAEAHTSTPKRASSKQPQASGGSVGQQVYAEVEKYYKSHKKVLTHKELISPPYNYDKSTAFRHRNRWLLDHPDVTP